MNPNILEQWSDRGWLLDASVMDAPGEIINTGGGPYYVGVERETGYRGNSHPVILSRYLMGMKLGRPLQRNEIIRFRSKNKNDFRLSNLILHSKLASAGELFRVNGDPVLGYSHCLCGCGEPLDLAKQKERPHAYLDGHKPRSRRDAPKDAKLARKTRTKVIVEELAKVGQPLLVIQKEHPMDEDPLKEFRALFEKMIHNLPWNEFKELLHLLLEIQTRQEKP